MIKGSSNKEKSTVRTFALASFLHDMGSDMIFSVWPVYVTTVLKANMIALGFIDGLGDAIVSISQAVSGYISDRIKKRKLFVWIGYLFGSISHIGYAISPTWQWLVPFRVLDRSGKMRGSPRDAIVSEVSTIKDRGKNFGILRAMDNLGAVVGICIAVVFLGIVGYKTLFYIAAIPSILAALLVLVFITEPKTSGTKIYKGVQFKDFSRNLKLYTLSSALFALASFSYSFLLIYAKGNGFQISTLPIFYLIFTVVAAIGSYPFGKLSDTIGRKKILYLSLLLWTGTLGLLIVSKSFLAIITVFILYGLHKGALEPVQKTLVAELSPKNFTASTLGGFQMIIGLCSLPASFLAGLLWDKINLTAPLYFSLILTILSAIILFFVKERN